MKCKRIIKVVSALALTLALLVSSGVVSFAAEKTYTTTTTYKDQNTIEVKSVATGLSKGDMVTYVAFDSEKGSEFSQDNAVYIDQATADANGKATFTYQADSDDVKATVLFGGSTEETAVTNVTQEGWTVYLSVYQDETAVMSSVIVPTMDDAYEGEYLAREFEVKLDNGYAVSKVTIDGVKTEAWSVKNSTVTVFDKSIKNTSTVSIFAEEVADVFVTIGTVEGGKNTITAFGKAVCTEAVEVGILISKNGLDLDSAVAWDKAENYESTVKLEALGRGANGGFCVEVEDDLLEAGDYNVATFAGEKMSVNTKQVTVTAE